MGEALFSTSNICFSPCIKDGLSHRSAQAPPRSRIIFHQHQSSALDFRHIQHIIDQAEQMLCRPGNGAHILTQFFRLFQLLSASWAVPIIAFKGVRMSWDIFARNLPSPDSLPPIFFVSALLRDIFVHIYAYLLSLSRCKNNTFIPVHLAVLCQAIVKGWQRLFVRTSWQVIRREIFCHPASVIFSTFRQNSWKPSM